MSDPKPSDRDDDEITPEMIEAGLRELTCYERGVDDGAECIRAIYSAMLEAKFLSGDKENRPVG